MHRDLSNFVQFKGFIQGKLLNILSLRYKLRITSSQINLLLIKKGNGTFAI
jgi:hypothetical protein